MIGHNCPINTHFIGRRVAEKNIIDQDPITSRIIWLSGLEIGFNRLGNRDTMSRYIYIYMEHLMKMKLEPQLLLDV